MICQQYTYAGNCRRMSALIASVLLLVGIPLSIYGQDCLKDVRSVFQKLNFPTSTHKGTAYFMEFTSLTTMRDTTKVKNTSLTTSMLISGNVLRVKSSEMEVYQDEKHIVIIVPKQKTVLVRNYSPVEDQRTAMEKILFLQDTVFNSCVVKSCKELKGEGESNLKEVQVEIKKGYLAAFPFNALTVVIDPVRQMLKKATVHYTQKQPVESISVTYHVIDYDYPVPKDISKPAISFALKGNTLLPKYSGYRLVDVR